MGESRDKSKRIFVFAAVFCAVVTQVLAYVATLDVKSKSYASISMLGIYAILFQWISFIYASGVLGNARTEMYYDLTGAATFFSLTVFSAMTHGWGNLSTRQLIASFGVLSWCSRLGLFLFTRIVSDKGVDSRFTEIKANVFRFWTAWTLQGLWTFLTALPVYILNSVVDRKPFGGTRDMLGLSLWVCGFLFEALADQQKRTWKADPKNKGLFINKGLWAISRHPNYFGEIVLWVGMLILCSEGFTHMGQIGAAVMSPLFVATLLINISGIPMLEESANKHWGDSAEYKAYKAKTPVLIPFIGRAGDAKF